MRYAVALTEVALWSRGLSRRYAEMLLNASGVRRDEVYALYLAAFVLDFQWDVGGSFNSNPVAYDSDLQCFLEEEVLALPCVGSAI